MTYDTLDPQVADGVATIWLNRPDVRNAMNDAMITELNQAIEAAVQDPQVRVIVMAGRGAAFCSGGDLQWMKSARNMSASDANDTKPSALRNRRPLMLRLACCGSSPLITPPWAAVPST